MNVEIITQKAKYDDIKVQLEDLLQDLILVSESDEKLEFYEFVDNSDECSVLTIEKITSKLNEKLEIVNCFALETFFEQLTTIQDWYGECEKGQAILFQNLQHFLSENLTKISVLEIGLIEVKVYVIGRYQDARWLGFKSLKIQT